MELEALVPNLTLCWHLAYLRILSTSGQGVASMMSLKGGDRKGKKQSA